MHNLYYIKRFLLRFIFLVFSTFLVYIIEDRMAGGQQLIKNAAEGIYWAIITVTMVGYGDLSPVSDLGEWIQFAERSFSMIEFPDFLHFESQHILK